MKEVNSKARLLRYTKDPVLAVGLAARLCYSPDGIDDLEGMVTPEVATPLIRRVRDMGHLSTFEHATFTFGLEGISRAMTHQLVRHRLASYSQQSQRYVGENPENFEYVVPPSIAESPIRAEVYKQQMHSALEAYKKLLDAGVPAEDARFVLPNGAETKIIVSMNARELLHFYGVRTCNRAQWEIRRVAEEMLRLSYAAAPVLFETAGPSCTRGPCPEGKLTCGKKEEVKEKYATMRAA